jgi:hypothetical protein
VVAVEDTDNQQDSQTLKYQPRHSKLQEEDSGLLIRLSNVWRQRFGTLRDMVVYYRHSPNASHELKQSVREFMTRRKEFLVKVVSSTKPMERLQAVWQFSYRQIEAVWKNRKN